MNFISTYVFLIIQDLRSICSKYTTQWVTKVLFLLWKLMVVSCKLRYLSWNDEIEGAETILTGLHDYIKAQNNGQQVAGHDDRPNIF